MPWSLICPQPSRHQVSNITKLTFITSAKDPSRGRFLDLEHHVERISARLSTCNIAARCFWSASQYKCTYNGYVYVYVYVYV